MLTFTEALEKAQQDYPKLAPTEDDFNVAADFLAKCKPDLPLILDRTLDHIVTRHIEDYWQSRSNQSRTISRDATIVAAIARGLQVVCKPCEQKLRDVVGNSRVHKFEQFHIGVDVREAYRTDSKLRSAKGVVRR